MFISLIGSARGAFFKHPGHELSTNVWSKLWNCQLFILVQPSRTLLMSSQDSGSRWEWKMFAYVVFQNVMRHQSYVFNIYKLEALLSSCGFKLLPIIPWQTLWFSPPLYSYSWPNNKAKTSHFLIKATCPSSILLFIASYCFLFFFLLLPFFIFCQSFWTSEGPQVRIGRLDLVVCLRCHGHRTMARIVWSDSNAHCFSFISAAHS